MAGQKSIKELYSQLYEDCKDYPKGRNKVDVGKDPAIDCYAHFVSMIGKSFERKDKDVRFMLIGRSTNGWNEKMDTESAETFGKCAQSQLTDPNRWNWIELVNGKPYVGDDHQYSLNRSCFWTYSKEIWLRLKSKCEESDNRMAEGKWMENIAWSNLCKLSPKKGGNPGKKLQEAQRDICREILQCEIDTYKPTHILFVTGYKYWFEHFADIFENVNNYSERNVSRGSDKNYVFVEATATYYNGVKVVVSCRPERRPKEQFVDAVVSAFGVNSRFK